MLPVEARAAQMLLVMVTSPDVAKPAIASGQVGGFGLKGNQVKDVGTQIASAVDGAPLTPFVAADEEGGTVQRLRLALGELPAAATVAKGTPEDAATLASQHATAMHELGFNMNFAPVADVGSGSGLGTRSFGTDPAKVSTFVEATWHAMQKAGVIPVIKHWPGIGAGTTDPHVKLTSLAGIDTLRAKDLVPFQNAIAAKAPAIMVTHAEVPGLTPDGVPASLSKEAITGELRGTEGFKGLIITDSLGMGAIAATDTQAQAAEKAIAAGADVAMISGTDVVAAVHAQLVDALSSGRIPPEQALASVRRVLAAKGVEGQCLDAVARYSAIARQSTSTTAATGGASVTTVAGSNSGSASSTTLKTGTGSSTTVKVRTTSPSTTAKSGSTTPSTTARNSAGSTATTTTIDSGING